MNKVSVWLRAAMLAIVILGASAALYGRLVVVETRLTAVEKQIGAVYGRLFGPRVADSD